MNGRQSKRLRREAERLTVGRPARAYTDGVMHPSRRLAPDCTRAIYRGLKRFYRQGRVE